jgi:hypothetical protein
MRSPSTKRFSLAVLEPRAPLALDLHDAVHALEAGWSYSSKTTPLARSSAMAASRSSISQPSWVCAPEALPLDGSSKNSRVPHR